MRFIIFQVVFLTTVFSGCSTVTEYWPWNDEDAVEVQAETPALTEADYGYVTYIESGDLETVEARRKEAFYQMYTECNGKYEVIEEKSQESTTVSFSNRNGGDFNEKIKKITIKFICPE